MREFLEAAFPVVTSVGLAVGVGILVAHLFSEDRKRRAAAERVARQRFAASLVGAGVLVDDRSPAMTNADRWHLYVAKRRGVLWSGPRGWVKWFALRDAELGA